MKNMVWVVTATVITLCWLQPASGFWWDREDEGEATPAASVDQQTEKSELLAEIERLQQAFSYFREDRARLKEQLAETEKARAALEEQVTVLSRQMEDGRATIADLKMRLREAGSGRRERASEDALREQLAEADGALTRERRLRREKESEVERLAARLADLEDEVEKAGEQAMEMAKTPEAPRAEPTTEPAAQRPARTDVVEATFAELDDVADVSGQTMTAAASGEVAELLAEGNRLLRAGATEEAQTTFARALVLAPQSEEALMGLASCAYASGELEAAKMRVTELIDQNPRNADALGLRAMISWREGNVDTAGRLLEQALQLDPENAQLYNYQGILAHSGNRLSDAAAAFDKAVTQDPAHAEAQFNLSVVLATMDSPDLEKSKSHYERALRLGSERNELLEEILYP